jgi:hypothetical protein
MKNGGSAKVRAVSEKNPRSMNVPGKTVHASNAAVAQMMSWRIRRGMRWEKFKGNPAL